MVVQRASTSGKASCQSLQKMARAVNYANVAGKGRLQASIHQ